MTNCTTMNYKQILLLAILLSISQIGDAKLPKKKNLLRQLFKPTVEFNSDKYLKGSSNEFQATSALLFVGYKRFVSSQDMEICVFTPSCSVYAIESFRTDNLFKAYLKTFDRLTRCHPLTAKGEYPHYKNTVLLYDPVH